MLLLIRSSVALLLLASLNAKKDSKIFGGRNCDIARYPFYIYMEYYVGKSKFMCGGSLLTTSTVLTAGHCCDQMTSATLFSGYYRNTHDYDQTTAAVIPPAIHPNFTSTTLINDVCIVTLKKPFRLTKRTRLVVLPPKKKLKEMMQNENEGKMYDLQIMGYGVNKRDKPNGFSIDESLPFQCTNSVLRTQKKCLEAMRDLFEKSKYDKTSMFCHYNPATNKTKGSCEGDSGSPIIYANAQIGLISWGPNEEVCTDRMEVATRLDAAYDWVMRVGMKSSSKRTARIAV